MANTANPKDKGFLKMTIVSEVHVINKMYKSGNFKMGLVLIHQSRGHCLSQWEFSQDTKEMVTTVVVSQAFIALPDQNYNQKKTQPSLLLFA